MLSPHHTVENGALTIANNILRQNGALLEGVVAVIRQHSANDVAYLGERIQLKSTGKSTSSGSYFFNTSHTL